MATNLNVEPAFAVPALIRKNSAELPRSIWRPEKFSEFTKDTLRVMERHWQRPVIWFSGEISIKNSELSMRTLERFFGKPHLEGRFKTAQSRIESMESSMSPF